MLFWLRKKLNKDAIEKINPQRQAINRSLITLSSGAILLTFTFLQFLEKESLIHVGILKWSWICFGIVILLGIFFQIILLNFEASWLAALIKWPKGKKFDQLEKKERIELLNGIAGSWRLFSFAAFLEVFQSLAFFIGIVLIIIFMFYNF